MNKVAIVGFGYWGPNIVRNFQIRDDCQVRYICDLKKDNLIKAEKLHPEIETTDNFDKIINDDDINIVAIVTPVSTHFELAKRVLKSKKHLFIEKPMVQNSDQAKELIYLCEKNNLVGVVDHTFLFTGAIQKIKNIIDSGEIGELVYFDSTRVNLGIFQHDVDVIWDLAPHDLSILFYISNIMPEYLVANGIDILNNGLVDIAYLNLKYKNKMIANFHLNWFSPVKIRRIIFGGSKKMILFDDMETVEKIKVYDTGISVVNAQSKIHELQINYRVGDMSSPFIANKEALKIEIDCFLNDIKTVNIFPNINGLKAGKKVVDILSSASESLKNNTRVRL